MENRHGMLCQLMPLATSQQLKVVVYVEQVSIMLERVQESEVSRIWAAFRSALCAREVGTMPWNALNLMSSRQHLPPSSLQLTLIDQPQLQREEVTVEPMLVLDVVVFLVVELVQAKVS